MDAPILWLYYSAPEVEVYGGEYTQVLAMYIIDHDISVTAF